MSSRDKYLLEYRPKIEWQTNILGIVETSGLADDTEQRYVIPEEIQAMLDNPITEAIRASVDLLDKIRKISDDLSKCMQDTLVFDGYRNALESEDADLIDHYESYSATSLGGRTQAEAYGMLYRLEKEFEGVPSFLEKQFLNSEGTTDDLEIARQKELQFFNEAIASDIVKSLEQDLATYAIRGAIAKASTVRIINAQEFVDNLSSVLSTTLNDHYGGQIQELVGGLFEAPTATLSQMQQMNEVLFAKKASETAEITRRMIRLNNPELKENIQLQAQDLAKIKLTGLELLRWAQNLNLDDEENPFISYLGDVAEITEEVDYAFEKQLVDLYKFNVLDEQIKNNYIYALSEKHRVRQIYNLSNDILEKRKTETNIPYVAADKFIKEQGLNSGGGLCSEYAPRTITHALSPPPMSTSFVSPTFEILPVAPPSSGGGGGGGGEPINADELRIGNYRIAFNTSNQNLEVFYTETL